MILWWIRSIRLTTCLKQIDLVGSKEQKSINQLMVTPLFRMKCLLIGANKHSRGVCLFNVTQHQQNPLLLASVRGDTQFGYETQSTHSMYFRETFWVCLVLMVRMYICRAARRRAMSYFSSEPNLSRTTSLQLWVFPKEKKIKKRWCLSHL